MTSYLGNFQCCTYSEFTTPDGVTKVCLGLIIMS